MSTTPSGWVQASVSSGVNYNYIYENSCVNLGSPIFYGTWRSNREGMIPRGRMVDSCHEPEHLCCPINVAKSFDRYAATEIGVDRNYCNGLILRPRIPVRAFARRS